MAHVDPNEALPHCAQLRCLFRLLRHDGGRVEPNNRKE
jgi:hypothetical protein